MLIYSVNKCTRSRVKRLLLLPFAERLTRVRLIRSLFIARKSERERTDPFFESFDGTPCAIVARTSCVMRIRVREGEKNFRSGNQVEGEEGFRKISREKLYIGLDTRVYI